MMILCPESSHCYFQIACLLVVKVVLLDSGDPDDPRLMEALEEEMGGDEVDSQLLRTLLTWLVN